MQDERKLNFLVIGAQKCATSWMYYCLKEHPQLQVPNDKREFAYLGGRAFNEKGEKWYFKRFNPQQKGVLRGEVAVDIMLDPNSAKNVEPYMKDPRFIAMIRNPVERMISAYYWSVRAGQLPNRPLNDALAEFLDDDVGFPVRRANNYLDELVQRGFYAKQIRPYLERFGRDRLLVMLYDDVKNNAQASLSKAYKFLGVDATFRPSSIDDRPKANSYNPYLLKIQNSLPFARRPVAKLMDYIHQTIKVNQSAPLDQSLEKKLMEKFAPHIDEMEALLRELPESNRPDSCDLMSNWQNT